MKNYQRIAGCLDAINSCRKVGNQKWEREHHDTIMEIVRNQFPAGSGWDCGTKFDFDASNSEKLIFSGSFHHMDDNGFYDGWTDHSVIVTPSLMSGFNIRITGRDRNEIKEYLYDIFCHSLNGESE